MCIRDRFASDWPIAGAPPDGITAGDAPDFALTLCPAGDALHLVPRIGVLGDVYKRQPTELSISSVTAVFGAPVVIWLLVRRNSEPVSYTHLDVYKRQVLCGCLQSCCANRGL